jgi:hypothetical protein
MPPGARSGRSGRSGAGGTTSPDAAQTLHSAILGRSRPKYGNQVTYVGARRFASKREAARFGELQIAEQAGVIADLDTQVLYRFEVNGVKVGRYTADFRYRVVATGEIVVEDVKGMRVRDWSRTKKLMLACHGITVREI